MARNPITALFGRKEEERSNAVDALAQAFFYGGNVSASGVRVTPDTALASVAVAACIEVRAETFSALPGGVYRKEDRVRTQLFDHDVARLLFDRPNDLMTGGELQRWTQMRKDISGNAYWRIVWRNGRPAEIWPLYGTNPEVKISKGKIAYKYNGDEITPAGAYPATDIIQHKGPFLKNPLEAASPIDMIKDTIGLSIASEQFFGRFLNNGTHFPNYLETDNALSDKDLEALAKSLGSTAGVLGAGKTRIFDRGLKLKQNQMSLKDADLSGQMRWYLEQICRIYRVPLPLVQDWTHGTYTNSEQAGLWFAQHTITPIAVDYERTTRKLFIPGEENNYVKFNVDAILRGDYMTRTQGYSTLISAGVLSRNEARSFEDLDPYDGGDEYLVPLNMQAQGDNTASQRALFESAGLLIRSGFEPGSVLDALGLPTMEYQDVQPVTVRPVDESGLQVAPAAAPDPNAARSLLQPILDDAIERISIRAKQDAERGRDKAVTRAWAEEHVLPPVIAAFNRAGIEIEVPWPTELV